jgi:formamidopyrimidine-DNA glycosylase
MPELPEVETTRRGIEPHLLGQTVTGVIIRQARLRWPVSPELSSILPGLTVTAVQRRAKYLLIAMDSGGWLILHLGMSGSLRVLPADTPVQKHDHVDIRLANGACLRLRDPRRFGAVLWTVKSPHSHPLLTGLGPEPWEACFDGEYLYQLSRDRVQPVKNFIMDSRTVVGVGNIYANESLFATGIHPARPAGRIARLRYAGLADTIRAVLEAAIQQGGTTLRDFRDSQGRPGYFAQALKVYGRAGEPCPCCGRVIQKQWVGQRSAFFCPRCQT